MLRCVRRRLRGLLRFWIQWLRSRSLARGMPASERYCAILSPGCRRSHPQTLQKTSRLIHYWLRCGGRKMFGESIPKQYQAMQDFLNHSALETLRVLSAFPPPPTRAQLWALKLAGIAGFLRLHRLRDWALTKGPPPRLQVGPMRFRRIAPLPSISPTAPTSSPATPPQSASGSETQASHGRASSETSTGSKV